MSNEKVFKYYLDELARKCFNKPFKKLTYAEQTKLSEYEYDLRHTKWKPVIIDGKDTGALVSNTGIVVSKHGVPFAKAITKDGYERVSIAAGKTYAVHRLVAIAFIPNPENKPEVDHINAIKTFNWVGNLRWASRQENMNYAKELGLIKSHHEGEDCNLAVYTNKQIHEVCRLLQDPDNNPSKIAKMTNVDKCTVQAIRVGKVWKCISQNYVFPDIDYTKGEGKVNSKFTDNDIKNVCKALEDPYKTLADISKETGVSFDTVHKIYQGKRWTHISKDYNITKRENPKSKLIIDEYKKGKSNPEIYDVLVKEFGESGDRRHILLQIGDVVRRYKNKVESSTTSESA